MKEEKYVIRESLRIWKELTDIKVTNTVDTFLNEDSDGLWIIRLATTQAEPKKVTNTVDTFLNEDSNATAHR